MSPAINKSKIEQLTEFLEELQKFDLKIVYDSIGQALQDFSQFVAIMSQKLDLIRPETSEQPPEGAQSGE
jgi:hypothetical protein